MSAMVEGHSAVLILSVLKPAGRSSLSTNIFVEDNCREGKNNVNLLKVLLDASIKG